MPRNNLTDARKLLTNLRGDHAIRAHSGSCHEHARMLRSHLPDSSGIAAPGVLGNDRNAAGGAASLVTGPLHGSLTLKSDGSFTYTSAHNYRGKDAFTYRIKLGSIWSLPTIVTITVG